MAYTQRKTSCINKAFHNTKEYIILHHTAGNNLQDAFKALETNASVQYVVDFEGKIYQYNTEDDVLYHAGVSSWKGKDDISRYSIGIEILGGLNKPFTDLQRKAVAVLVKDIATRNKIPKENILRHCDITQEDSPLKSGENQQTKISSCKRTIAGITYKKGVGYARKTDVDDSFWNAQFKTFEAYRESLLTPTKPIETFALSQEDRNVLDKQKSNIPNAIKILEAKQNSTHNEQQSLQLFNSIRYLRQFL